MTPAEHAEVIRQALVEGASDWKIADQSLAALVAQAEEGRNWKESCARYLAGRMAAEVRIERAEAALREIEMKPYRAEEVISRYRAESQP